MAGSTRRLRELLASGETLVAPFVFDALQARLAAAAGFQALYMTGFGTAAARGLPDLGLLTLDEMAGNARIIARSSDLPLICDADTGYGTALHVWRTVHEYEEAGAAALHIEDQVWPKRCGFLEGKQVVAMEEMVGKVRAACDARRDPDFVIIARSDALEPHGWDEVERRVRAYRKAGADLLFVDGIRTVQDLETYAERLGDLPLLFGAVEVGAAHAGGRGFRVVIDAGTLFAAYEGMRDAMHELARTGTVPGQTPAKSLRELFKLLEVEATLERGRKYDAVRDDGSGSGGG